MKPPRILIIPARRHILEAYCEYIIRYLSDEFYFEMGYPSVPPYDTLKERQLAGVENPLLKNPDDFDLIYPHFHTHLFLDPPPKYYHKLAYVYLEPGSDQGQKAVIAATSDVISKGLGDSPHHNLRFGIDTDLFKPYPMARTDDLLHVGFIGNIQTPRRYIKELFFEALKDVEGIRLMVWPTTYSNNTRADEVELMGGTKMLESIVDGDKWFPGLPNIYNQMDVFVRCDIDNGCQLSVYEAAACGVPVVCVDSGSTRELARAGGAIQINNGNGDLNGSWEPDNLNRIAKEIREAVIELRDDPGKRKKMGKTGRKFIEENWTWENHIPAWREFFREGVASAQMSHL